MKKRIFFTLLMVGIITVSSLKAQLSFGPGILYASDIETMGISANVSYNFAGKLGAMATYTYFTGKTLTYGETSQETNWWALDLDGTYTLSSKEKSKFYALAGWNIIYWDYGNAQPNDNHSGFNLGGGWKFGLSKNFELVPEARYTFANGGGYFRGGLKLMFVL